MAYSGGPACSAVNFKESAISAFCTAGSHVFVATEGRVYQYECSANAFDPAEIDKLTEISSVALQGVSRMEYSGTDTTFDMRIYA